MSNFSEELAPQPPIGDVKVVYLGPAAPHWEVRSGFGDPHLIESFRDRGPARLVLRAPRRAARRGVDVLLVHARVARLGQLALPPASRLLALLALLVLPACTAFKFGLPLGRLGRRRGASCGVASGSTATCPSPRATRPSTT